MRVNISVHGRWHAFELANGLHRRGAMGRLVTTYPAIVARRFVAPGIEIRSRPLLELRRRLYDRWQIGAKPDLAIAIAFARYAARTATSDADILVGWSSAILEAIALARSGGLKVVVERGSTHILNQMRILTEAYDEFGLVYDGTQAGIIERELAEYDAADAIAVPTSFAADSFVAEGIARDKLIVNPYGVDLTRFEPTPSDPNTTRPVRVLFVGRVGIQKGVPWLLKAFARLDGAAELHLIGPVDSEAAVFLGSRSANVVVRGALPGPALAAEYAAADVFCLPSLQEGMPLTLLQAMASGLPSVVSPAAQGPVCDGLEGLVVPAKSVDDMAAALERLIRSPEERRSMGTKARAVVAQGYGWQDYADRALAAYGTILA